MPIARGPSFAAKFARMPREIRSRLAPRFKFAFAEPPTVTHTQKANKKSVPTKRALQSRYFSFESQKGAIEYGAMRQKNRPSSKISNAAFTRSPSKKALAKPILHLGSKALSIIIHQIYHHRPPRAQRRFYSPDRNSSRNSGALISSAVFGSSGSSMRATPTSVSFASKLIKRTPCALRPVLRMSFIRVRIKTP